MRRALESLIIVLAATVAVTGCANGNKIWSYDEDTEVQAGVKQHARILDQTGTYNNTRLSDYVDAVGKKIAATSDRPKLQWHFTVIDSAVPNAFATQGGYVYITRGMLALLQSDAELAAILSHEIGHICAQDIPHQQAVGNIMALGVLATIVAVPEFLLFPQLAAAPEGAGMAAISRKDELNADQRGTEYLRRAGFPPEAMQTSMDMLTSMEAYEREQNKTAGKTSQWWHRVYASHPTTKERQEKISAATFSSSKKLEQTTGPQSEFLSYLDGLEVGSSKYQGIAYGNARYFADLQLTIEVPDGWIALLNIKRDQLWLVQPEKNARIKIEKFSSIDVNDPCKWLGYQPVTDTKPIRNQAQPSCTGLARKSRPTLLGDKEETFRAGVIAYSKGSGLGYLFNGYAEQKNFAEIDPIFLRITGSIEHLLPDRKIPNPPVLRIRLAKKGDTFASLARNSRLIEKNPESMLRLVNRSYPSGEPQPGKLIKIIE